ncbi:MAG: hypothetical protein HZA67_01370 [Rhodospirillales bacterium]|nr:hypothetical protein [Rhodospirillales bacterium]
MSDLIEHRGYFGSVHFSAEDVVFHGRLEFIRDLVTYEGTTVKGLKRAFHDAVDDYLIFCAQEVHAGPCFKKADFLS